MGFIACVLASALFCTLIILLLGWAGRRRSRARSRGPVTLHCFRP
jgi:hypothetical protein